MRCSVRWTALGLTLLAAVAAGPARAGTSGSPEVTDPVGDANYVSAYKSSLSAAPASLAPYDITSAWLETVGGRMQASMTLAAAPSPAGEYIITFDTPGCTGQDSALPPLPRLPTDSLTDAHAARGVFVILDEQYGPTLAGGYMLCEAKNDDHAASSVPVSISGNRITFTLPATRYLGHGTTAIGPMAFDTTVAAAGLVDVTASGRNFTF